MLRKSPILAKSARMCHPTSKANFKGKETSKTRVPRDATYKYAAMVAEWGLCVNGGVG
jgi:hypothetical protein